MLSDMYAAKTCEGGVVSVLHGAPEPRGRRKEALVVYQVFCIQVVRLVLYWRVPLSHSVRRVVHYPSFICRLICCSYHMQYAHGMLPSLVHLISSLRGPGISASTGHPFSPPTAFRTILRTNVGKLEKNEMMQGRCHKCKKWVAVEGVKDVPTKVSSTYLCFLAQCS